MTFFNKLHMLYRFWHYRLRTEKSGIDYLLKQELKNQVVVDVGANKGIYSYWMNKAVGPTAKLSPLKLNLN